MWNAGNGTDLRIIYKNIIYLRFSKGWFCRVGDICSNNTVVQPACNYESWNLIVATIYLQLIQNRYMFRSFAVLQCSYQHCVQPVVSDVEIVGYL